MKGAPDIPAGAAGQRKGPMVGRREAVALRPDLEAAWDAADALFRVRIPRSWWDRIDHADPADPLALQALPDVRELVADADDQVDPVGDAARSPMPWVVHKHADRVLLVLTKRCHLDCRYCFRRTHRPGEGEDPTPDEWRALLDYAANSGAREVILSGGDPLALSDRRLFEALDRVRSVPVVRVHTRAPITAPERVTDGLIDGLRARQPVWVVVHCNHVRELSPAVDDALRRLVDAGVPVLNQSVLLRGVNDDVDALVALCEALVVRRVFPYYLHVTDRVAGNAHLRVDAARASALWEGLARRVSGLALPRCVVDGPDGKVDVMKVVFNGTRPG